MISRSQHSRPPIERMLRIHEELRRGAFTNCTRLAETLEVSRKTIVRDVAFMRDRLELPIEFDARINAYRYTHAVSAFPTVQVSEGELLALLVARKALEQYRAFGERQWRERFPGRQTSPAEYQSFPRHDDAFDLNATSNSVSVTHRASGARWEVMLDGKPARK